MKKKVTLYLQSCGVKTSYSGNEKTLFLHYPKGKKKAKADLENRQLDVLEIFGMGLPFKLALQAK